MSSTRIIHVVKKPGAKFYKPVDKAARDVAKNIIRRKNFSDAAVDLLRTSGWEVIIDEYKAPANDKAPSKIDLPHVKIWYDNIEKVWRGHFCNPKNGQSIGEYFAKKTKKQVLEALIAHEITIRNNNL